MARPGERDLSFALNRADYDDLYALAGLESAPAETRKTMLAEAYPKSTREAVAELWQRGVEASESQLDHLMRSGRIRGATSGEGRNRKWLPIDIDDATEYLASEHIYLPISFARAAYAINPAQDIRAQNKALAENPDLYDAAQLVMEIQPGTWEAYGKVSYRRMRPEEQLDFQKRVE
ncbi:unnamed protein product, partial [marine sediment metagenome]